MIADNLRLPIFVQCDAQVYQQPELIELLGRAGCFQMFVGVESFSREALRGAHKLQNRPDRYSEIISLCRGHGITTHFSNILGFPEDTEEKIKEHLRLLRDLAPDVASFYILTPIPGTEQYEEFLDRNWITEQNLDRFDGTQVTWEHPNLPAPDLQRLLRHCYKKFFSPMDVASALLRIAGHRWDFRTPGGFLATGGYSVLSRLAVRRNDHPMAGGTVRVRRDNNSQYLGARKEVFGLEQVPLPRSLHARDWGLGVGD
jgi:radical SAM superfamily enzyme YgiQ (UPF0313 family)